MSIERCEKCSAIIDTDFDDGCYVEIGNMRSQTYDSILCEGCRERMLNEIYVNDEPPDELEMALAFNELESDRLRAARNARLKEEGISL